MNNKILFVSCMPDAFFSKLIEDGISMSQASQKFNKLIVQGFCHNGYDVDVLFSWDNIPANEYMTENFNGREIKYNVISSERKSIFKTIEKKYITKQLIKQWANDNNNGTVVVDALSTLSYDVLRISSKLNLNVISVVTDLKLKSLSNNRDIKNKIIEEYLFKRFYNQFKYSSSFVLLTEKMAKKIGVNGRKYVIVNGLCDVQIADCLDSNNINEKRIIMYSGEISKFYGVENLVKAFLSLDSSNLELHLYGSMFYDELPDIQKEHSNVKYMGIVPNETMINLQKEALFLVNPRLTKGEYNYYSFPSKNIEYLTSGRPVITTKLPCITDEYKDYFYFFEDDTQEGMAKSLRFYTNLSDDELDFQGRKAKHFVLEKMNNKVQIDKIIKELI